SQTYMSLNDFFSTILYHSLLYLLFSFHFVQWRPLRVSLFPYTTLFRSVFGVLGHDLGRCRFLWGGVADAVDAPPVRRQGHERGQDRKSTRLNSSHVSISYAVFCLKKKSRLITKFTNRHTKSTTLFVRSY